MTKINERATGAEQFSQFFEDKNIIDMLNDDAEGGEENSSRPSTWASSTRRRGNIY
jgi:hypothetical protein